MGSRSWRPAARLPALRCPASNIRNMKLLLALLLPAPSQAAIWPDAIGSYHRTAATAVKPAEINPIDRPVWEEYGLKDSESATYEKGAAEKGAADKGAAENGPSRFTATAWMLTDPT